MSQRASVVSDVDREGILAREDQSKESATHVYYTRRLLKYYAWLEGNDNEVYKGLLLPHDDARVDMERPLTRIDWQNFDLLVYQAFVNSTIDFDVSTSVEDEHGNITQVQKTMTKSLEDSRKYPTAAKYFLLKYKCHEALQGWNESWELFNKGMARNFTKAKEQGQVSENKADPLPFALYKWLAKVCLLNEYYETWSWLLTQWNQISRGKSVADMRFHMHTIVDDSILTTYSRTKADQAGRNLNPKHVYANPFDVTICHHIALGVYLSMTHERPGREASASKVYKSTGRGAKQRVERQLKSIFADPKYVSDIESIGGSHLMNILMHSIRKGPATAVSTADGNGCRLISVMRRGDWSLGKVLDAYIKWAFAGDQVIGRACAGLDTNSTNFVVLPPHFLLPTTQDDKDSLDEGITTSFGDTPTSIPIKFPGYRRVLLRLLASMVHHHDTLQALLPCGHNMFTKIAIYQDMDLLQRLKRMVTQEPGHVIHAATGIPREILSMVKHEQEQEVLTRKLDQLTLAVHNGTAAAEATKQTIDTFVTGFDAQLSSAIQTWLRNDATRQRVINSDNFESVMKTITQAAIQEAMQAFHVHAPAGTTMQPEPEPEPEPEPNLQPHADLTTFKRFAYVDGRFNMFLPEDWPRLLKYNLTQGWAVWMAGIPAVHIFCQHENGHEMDCPQNSTKTITYNGVLFIK